MRKEIVEIGIIHSPFKSKEEAPIQGKLKPEAEGRVEVYPQYEEGLKDVETFSHIILLYLFDRASEIKLVRPTFLDDEPHGVFATRHPCRPNGIGITTVKLLRRDRNILYVSGVDVLDKTPLIDIKPYIPRFDCFPEATEGWLTGLSERPKPKGRE
ncbi:MAG: tRNA (N6-threonylcarbamoyladenosine(37)-N6)-methyltransferase TrmO [Deltaproteobacteria bacterium]|nr:MAG: tRNA (N6-threonylcarbamoyladenosine(37)-N6)-methyltransferase TrmO [Deltaproteobacteria bacterium]